MKIWLSHISDLDNTDTWLKFKKELCETCHASCCTMPTEVKLPDLVTMGLIDEFELGEPIKQIAKRLMQTRQIAQFSHAHQVFTLARRANGDCIFLDANTRRCTIYEKRPQTCRNHPQKGPRPGYCAYRPKKDTSK